MTTTCFASAAGVHKSPMLSPGRRGQKFLRDLIVALDEMPVKRLIKNDLHAHGEVCTLVRWAPNVASILTLTTPRTVHTTTRWPRSSTSLISSFRKSNT